MSQIWDIFLMTQFWFLFMLKDVFKDLFVTNHVKDLSLHAEIHLSISGPASTKVLLKPSEESSCAGTAVVAS